jgi:hypothetical protein
VGRPARLGLDPRHRDRRRRGRASTRFAPHHERLVARAGQPVRADARRPSAAPRPDRDAAGPDASASSGRATPRRGTLADVADLAAALRGRFGIDPAALGPARMDRLWTRACAQHERWRAA